MARASNAIVPMTHEQRKLVEDNHNLIFGFLRRGRYDQDDWYGHAAIGLCKAAIVFDESKGFAFSTLAYTCMERAVWQEIRRLNSRGADQAVVGSLDFELAEEMTLYDITPDTRDYEDEAITNATYHKFARSLSDDEREIHQLQLGELSRREIGKKLGISQCHVSRKLKKIKSNLKGMLDGGIP